MSRCLCLFIYACPCCCHELIFFSRSLFMSLFGGIYSWTEFHIVKGKNNLAFGGNFISGLVQKLLLFLSSFNKKITRYSTNCFQFYFCVTGILNMLRLLAHGVVDLFFWESFHILCLSASVLLFSSSSGGGNQKCNVIDLNQSSLREKRTSSTSLPIRAEYEWPRLLCTNLLEPL